MQFPSFVLGNDTLIEAESVKYLGHIISNSLLDDNGIPRQCRQLYAQGNIIIRQFHMCSNDVKTICLLLFGHLWTLRSYGGIFITVLLKKCMSLTTIFSEWY